MTPSSPHPRAVSTLLHRAFLALVLGLLAAGCPASHTPDDPRPDCPEGDAVEWGGSCVTQDDCDPSYCGRLGGICVDNTWTCGECDLCFYQQIQHVEDTYMSCDMDTGFCVHPEE